MKFKYKLKSIAKKSHFLRKCWHLYSLTMYSIKHPSVFKINKRGRAGCIIQLVMTFSERDAIGNSIVELSNKLTERGFKNYILYLGSHSKAKNSMPYKFIKLNKNDTLIYHMCYGSVIANYYINSPAKTKMIIYHNITPSKYFFDNSCTSRDLDLGKQQLKELKNCTNLAICVSKYNEEELIKLGYKNTCVLKIPTRVNELLKYRVNKIDSNVLNFITVGRIARHKCIHDVITLFKEIHDLNLSTHLYIIGSFDNFKYMDELNSLISLNGLKSSVSFKFNVNEKELASFYSNADGYLCMSEHEGFCVPLIEAMAFQVPIFSYSSSAIPETLDGAGILFINKNNMKKNANIIVKTLQNEILINKMKKAEEIRFKDFDNDKILNSYIEKITKFN